MHSVNVLLGTDPAATLRTRVTWPLVIIHGLIDLAGFVTAGGTISTGVTCADANVSALQLDDDFTALVATCLQEFGLPPEQLVLEFTETVVIASPAAVDRLNDLAASGVTIAMDDFGTGYSALTALRKLPLRVVKIDRSFIAGSTTSREDRAVIEAIVGMATQLGLRTIAEGVERPDQQEFLESIGVNEAQGFFYLRPTPALEFGAWLGAHRAGALVAEPAAGVVIPFTPRHTA